ncbi:MAG: hypothetical protein CTY16_16290 [Methylobacter sp.]|nr:MAG: hypothetical protein CTY16_16290 [Methylobacter sp.]
MTSFCSRWQQYRAAILLAALGLLPGCSVYDVRPWLAPPDAALLIRQNGRDNHLSVVAGSRPITVLNGVRINPKQFPVTPSNSLAVETPVNPASAAPAAPAANLEQAQKKLIRYLMSVEKQPEHIEKIIADAEQLARQFPDDELMQSLLQRLSRHSDWQPVNSIINHAGIDFASVNGWQPESPFIRTRRALLPPVADNEHVIFADQRLVLLLTNPAMVSLHVDARLDDVPFLPESPTTLLYQVDDLPVQAIKLLDKADWQRLTLTIPAGGHALRFYQQKPVGNQYVKLRFDDPLSNLAVAQERPYFISTADAPLQFYSQGPSVLRIDELDGGKVSYRYQEVPEGWHTISLPPPAGKPRSLLRVSQRVVDLQPEPPSNRVIQRMPNPVPKPGLALDTHLPAEKVVLSDVFRLGKQEDGTLSPGVDFVRRNNKQESGAMLNEEQFAQYRLNYRYFDEPRDAYWNTQGLFRLREYGGPTFGLNESLYYNPDWLPFNVRSTAKIFAQAPHDDWEALGQWDLAIAQAYNLHPKTRVIPSLSFFARTLSHSPSILDQFAGLNPADPNFNQQILSRLNRISVPDLLSELGHFGLNPNDLTLISEASAQPTLKQSLDYINAKAPNLLSKIVKKANQRAQEIDQDVYTPYKDQHTTGLTPGLTLEHRPWLDTIWSAKGAVQSYEDLDFTDPDHYRTELHWQQLLGSVVLDASYRSAFYQANPIDRPNSSTRSYAELEVNWQHWTSHQNRFEVSAQYSYDVQRYAHLATLSLTLHFGEGRGLRDFAPNELDFRDIRQRQFTNGQNNFMHDAYPPTQ